ncbi:MAG: AraC family transcriptional regulator, partial [Gorillibacterium sp.]|nr:AraC family transcriptional regulator [Gorillibacterium sp.]
MLKQSSFAFREAEGVMKKQRLPFMTLDSIGWDSVDIEDYSYSGDQRPDTGHVIFQYTLRGQGQIDLDGSTHLLSAGSGFLVKIPSLHRYYFSSLVKEPWEFIWMNIRGEDAIWYWDRLIERFGPILQLHPESRPIQTFWKLFSFISNEESPDKFAISAHVFEWILSMMQVTDDDALQTQTNPIILKAKSYMKQALSQPITLDDVAAHVGVSKHYLCRLFLKFNELTPLEYMRRRRIELAASLIRNTEVSIQEIALQTGFDSSSYFGKIFRHYLGISPREYRMMKLQFPYKK